MIDLFTIQTNSFPTIHTERKCVNPEQELTVVHISRRHHTTTWNLLQLHLPPCFLAEPTNEGVALLVLEQALSLVPLGNTAITVHSIFDHDL